MSLRPRTCHFVSASQARKHFPESTVPKHDHVLAFANVYGTLPLLEIAPRSTSTHSNCATMAKGENSKKAAGNAKKAEVAAQKQAGENAKKSKAEAEEWSKGSKDSSKAYAMMLYCQH